MCGKPGISSMSIVNFGKVETLERLCAVGEIRDSAPIMTPTEFSVAYGA